MTVVIGMQAVDRFVMVADTRVTSDGSVHRGVPKIAVLDRWIIGQSGSADDLYYYLRTLTGIEPFDDPGFHADLLEKLYERYKRLNGFIKEQEQPNMSLLFARGERLYTLNVNGNLWETPWQTIGSGTHVADYLMLKYWRPRMPVEECYELGKMIVGEVATTQTDVALPAIGADTGTRIVRII